MVPKNKIKTLTVCGIRMAGNPSRRVGAKPPSLHDGLLGGKKAFAPKHDQFLCSLGT